MANKLPAAGEMSDTAAPIVYQQRFEDQLEGIKFAFGAYLSDNVSISGGQINPPEPASYIVVDTEGAAPTDNLDGITPTNYYAGAMLLLSLNNATRVVTLRHNIGGTEKLVLRGGTSWVLDNTDKYILFCYRAGAWREMFRSYGDDYVAQRSDMGLGDAATYDTGPGSGLDADTVDGLEASAFIQTGQQASDSAQLVGVPGANYARTDAAAGGQTFANVVTADAGLLQVNRASAGGQTIIDLQQGGVAQGRIFFDDQTNRLYLTGPAGLAGELVFLDFTTGQLHENRGIATGNFPVVTQEDLPFTADQLDIRFNTASGSLSPTDSVRVGINRRSFFPSVQIEGSIKTEVGADNSNLDNPRIRVYRSGGSGIDDYDLDWEYIHKP